MCGCHQHAPSAGPAGALARPRYEVGEALAAPDLASEQTYRRERLRRHNRHLHGWGILCGLHVVPAPGARAPWRVRVCPGYALDPCGNEILLSSSALLDLHEAWRLEPRADELKHGHVAIRAAEEPTRVAVTSCIQCGPCHNDEHPTRIRDGWELRVLWTPPARSTARRVDLCHPRDQPCPDKPSSLYVTLARVALPASEDEPIGVEHIDM